MKDIFVTIFTPLYNTEKYIGQAIKSVLKQTHSNFEYIIIDDCSTDNSVEKVKSFQDERIRLIEHSKNKGIIFTRNEGISLARGKYLINLDSDDLCSPSRVEGIIYYFEQNSKIDVVTSNGKMFIFHPLCSKIYIQNVKDNLQDSFFVKMLFKSPFIGAAVAFRLRNFKNEIVYDNTHRHCEDFGMYQKYLYQRRLGYIDKVFYRFRIRSGSDTSIGNRNINKRLDSFIPIYNQMFAIHSIFPSESELLVHLEVVYLSLKRKVIDYSFYQKKIWIEKFCNELLLKSNYNKNVIYKVGANYLFESALFHNKLKEYYSSNFSLYYRPNVINIFVIKTKFIVWNLLKKMYNR